MTNCRNSYDLVLDLVPALESDVVEHAGIIRIISDFVDHLNFETLGPNSKGYFELTDAGKIHFPYYSFGSVKSYFHLEYRELVLFAIYRKILRRYSRFVDVGGNLGLHSIIASKFANCEVHYTEPDPVHYIEASERFSLNDLEQDIFQHNVAASNFDGKANFVRVVDNTTGSHIEGNKINVYGPTETLKVQVSRFSNFISDTGRTFAKVDIEGAEVDALIDLSNDTWERFDCVVEITDTNSAKLIFAMAESRNLKVYSQKTSWSIARKYEDLPQRWDEGSVLISRTLNRDDFLS